MSNYSHASNLAAFCIDADKVNARIQSQYPNVSLEQDLAPNQCTHCHGPLLADEMRRGDTRCGLCVIDEQLRSGRWDYYIGQFNRYLYAADGQEAKDARIAMDRELQIAMHA
jgi:hypothetical protein